jgi:hypothetical protein
VFRGVGRLACWIATVNGHKVVHRATGRRCIPGRLFAQEVVLQLTHWWRTEAGEEPLIYHGWQLDESSWSEPGWDATFASLTHPQDDEDG